jgi:uncharacterized membrane protein
MAKTQTRADTEHSGSKPAAAAGTGKNSQQPSGDATKQADARSTTVDEILELEQRDDVSMTRSDHMADAMTAFSGSMIYVAIHAVWFVVWIAINLRIFGMPAFDPYPFGLLTMIVSLEAIFLATFVLISQNRQAVKADRRAKVDLQVNMIAEREITKLVEMVAELHDELLGRSKKQDLEIDQMRQPTHVGDLADAVDKAEQEPDPKSAGGPASAAGTET